MTRVDLIKLEQHLAETYRREAVSRRSKNPALADRLMEWSRASLCRAEEMRCGPLFGAEEAAGRDGAVANNAAPRAA